VPLNTQTGLCRWLEDEQELEGTAELSEVDHMPEPSDLDTIAEESEKSE
jgi:hypothetical protein